MLELKALSNIDDTIGLVHEVPFVGGRAESVDANISFDSDLTYSHYDVEGIVIIGLITFVGDAARGIIYPALWPLCAALGGDKVDLGYLIAIFACGRLAVTTHVGIIADNYGHRKALLVSSILLLIGALMWGQSPFVGGLPVLYLSQFVMGLGTGLFCFYDFIFRSHTFHRVYFVDVKAHILSGTM